MYYYISDIHLDYKIGQYKKEFDKKWKKKKTLSKKVKEEYIRKVVREIKSSFIEDLLSNEIHPTARLILLNGDISADYWQLDVFFSEYVKPVMVERENVSYIKLYNLKTMTVFIPGNHELWSDDLTIDEMNRKINELVYRKYGIVCLQNSVLLYAQRCFTMPFRILSLEEIAQMSVDELQMTVARYDEIIIGGTGFSGYNPIHNAETDGLYRETVKTLQEDIALTEEFEWLHQMMSNALREDTVICFTHTQIEDWLRDKPNPNWIYVNGHTHKNYFCNDHEKTVFADNQIGYYETHYPLKWFLKEMPEDPLRYYKDGIYEITISQYRLFNICKNIHVNFGRQDINRIKMLKKNGIYMFFGYSSKTKKHYILDGARIRKMEYNFDHYYFYMEVYYLKIKNLVAPIQRKLKDISQFVQRMGGDGRIHGCIVDIDFFNHLYYNLFDGKVTAYHAIDVVDKTVYPSIGKLLEAQRPDLYGKYLDIESNNGNLIISESQIVNEGFKFLETDIYKYSNKYINLQYVTEKKIIRNWNENILHDVKQLWRQIMLSLDNL